MTRHQSNPIGQELMRNHELRQRTFVEAFRYTVCTIGKGC